MRLESHHGLFAVVPLFMLLASSTVRAQSVEEQFRIPGDPATDTLFLRHLRPAGGAPVREGRVVLLVHGATFPSATAAAFRFDGHSWMDDLSAAGFDVWALDFPGYGGSDRYREMQEPALANAPVGRAEPASRHLGRAVGFIARHAGVRKVSIVAHSWGTLVAGHYASEFPDRIDRLVLFGPVAMRSGPAAERKRAPAYTYVTKEDQWAKFTTELPEGEQPKIRAQDFDRWWQTYLESDATSATRTPHSVQIPYGPQADVADAWSGRFPYDPAKITAPALIVRGEWDTVTRDADAAWLFHALRNAPLKRSVVISRGTHVMHLEESRFQLYREVRLFLEE